MINQPRFTLKDRTHGMRLIFVSFVISLVALALVSCSNTSSGEIVTPGDPGGEVLISTETPKSTDFPPGFPTPDPEKYQECMDKGGRWEVLGFSGPGCNLPTMDGGVPCRNSDECESACLAADESAVRANGFTPNLQRIDELNAQGGDLPGACSPWQETFGCHVWSENGRYAAICVD